MQSYEVRISLAAFADMADLRAFLKAMMTEEGAIRLPATGIAIPSPSGRVREGLELGEGLLPLFP